MTKDELIKKLKALKFDDIETRHIDADALLIEFINDPEITKVYDDLDKWYA